MAKPKKTENMSVLDYFYKKLNWLVKKIETSSRRKISKRDLLIYSVIIIFIVSVRFGGVIGAFTFVLAAATIWNAKITRDLLKQSEKAFKQSRRALENDVFRNIVFSTSQLNAQLRIAGFPLKKRPKYIENFAAGMLATLQSTDPSLFEKISKAIENWCKIDNRFPAKTFLNALEKMKQYSEG